MRKPRLRVKKYFTEDVTQGYRRVTEEHISSLRLDSIATYKYEDNFQGGALITGAIILFF